MDELSSTSVGALPRLSARRLLLLGGIALIVAGMVFGDFFAVFILHQNASRVGASLAAASHAALQGDAFGVAATSRDTAEISSGVCAFVQSLDDQGRFKSHSPG